MKELGVDTSNDLATHLRRPLDSRWLTSSRSRPSSGAAGSRVLPGVVRRHAGAHLWIPDIGQDSLFVPLISSIPWGTSRVGASL